MSAPGEKWLSVGAAALAAGLSLYACGGSDRDAKAPTGMTRPIAGTPADDQSRCDYKGRPDREVEESAGPGSKHRNIRRVYGVIGEGEDRRRVLLCREVDTNLDGVKDVVRTYSDKGEPLTELSDTNFDGQIDNWISFTRGRVSKVAIDHNGDGKPDETRYYVGGKLTRAQRDTNFDGKPDVWEIYDDGQLERMGVDLDHDGHVDRWDRDEIALREVQQKEQREEEAQKAKESEISDAGVTDARVSVRKR